MKQMKSAIIFSISSRYQMVHVPVFNNRHSPYLLLWKPFMSATLRDKSDPFITLSTITPLTAEITSGLSRSTIQMTWNCVWKAVEVLFLEFISRHCWNLVEKLCISGDPPVVDTLSIVDQFFQILRLFRRN